jgi:hypothetical protein
MAHAADTTSSANVNTVAPSLLSKISASYMNVFYGPSIDSMGTADQPVASAGAANVPLMMKNYVTAGYKLSDDTTIAAVLYWRNFARQIKGSNFMMRDAYAKLSKGSLYKNGNYNVYGDLRLTAPTYSVSQDQTFITSVGSKILQSYTVPNSRLTLALENYVEVRAFSDRVKAGSLSGYDTELYAGPQLSYQITPTLAAWGLYELDTYHMVAGAGDRWVNEFTDFEPGLSWDITKNLNFSPFLNITTGQSISLNSTSINAILNWKLL